MTREAIGDIDDAPLLAGAVDPEPTVADPESIAAAAAATRAPTTLGDPDVPGPRSSLSGRGGALVVLAAGQAKRYGGLKPLAPVGPAGEAVIDLVASDALAAGFGTVVLVVGPSTGPAIRYHVARTWPSWVDVRFAVQELPLGTVDAVLAGTAHLAPGSSFGIANADDVYGEGALRLLADHLAGEDAANAVVCYRIGDSVVGDAPVTRGVCEIGPDGTLRAIDERRQVRPAGGGRFVAADGKTPVELGAGTLVSVNLWAFRAAMRRVLEGAMAGVVASDGARARTPERTESAGGADRRAAGPVEVLLPEVVGTVLAGGPAHRDDHPWEPGPGAGRVFRILKAPGRCVGVTHPEDLPLVQGVLAGQVGRGERPAGLWGTR